MTASSNRKRKAAHAASPKSGAGPSSPASPSKSPSKASQSASSASHGLPATLANFVVIPITYSSQATHVLYARKHDGSRKKNAKGKERAKSSYPEGRTHFLVNVPPDATERELTVLFKECGTVERVGFEDGGAADLDDGEDEESGSDDASPDAGEGDDDAEDADPRPKKKRKADREPEKPKVVPLPSPSLRTLRRTGQNAHVVFLDPSSLARALKPSSKPLVWPSSADTDAPRGLAHYAARYAALRPPLDIVRAHADSWMEASEAERASKRKESEYKKGEAIVDEDGFTLVTRGGAYGKTLGGGVGVARKSFLEEQSEGGNGSAGTRRRKKKDTTDKGAFYAFQIHEKRRNDLIELKRKFEEDKEKVAKMKESRKFKPY